jgi:hypothetical protein
MKKLAIILAVALTARAEQKNVQLLTNMSDTQLQRTMNLMRSALGVHCDYCHVVDKENGWQWDKDDKKEKRTAREMIAMTIKINKEQFNGRAEVSCYTCHRGSTRPVSLVALPQTAPPFPTPKPERPTGLPALEDIVKKYTAALGNAAQLQKPRILKGTRTTYEGKPVPIEVQESGDRWHISADTPAGHVEQAVSGDQGWSKDAKGVVTDLAPAALENFHELATLLAPPPPSAIPADARVVGKETLPPNAETVIVAYRTPDGARHRLYFNTATGFVMRQVTVRDTPVGAMPAQTDFDQWRDAGGAAFPFLVRTSLVDPWIGSTRQYSQVTLDAKVDEAAFAKPK